MLNYKVEEISTQSLQYDKYQLSICIAGMFPKYFHNTSLYIFKGTII